MGIGPRELAYIADFPIFVLIIIGVIVSLSFSYLPVSKSSKTMTLILGIVGSIVIGLVFFVAFTDVDGMNATSPSAGITIIGGLLGSFGLPLVVDSLKKKEKSNSYIDNKLYTIDNYAKYNKNISPIKKKLIQVIQKYSD